MWLRSFHTIRTEARRPSGIRPLCTAAIVGSRPVLFRISLRIRCIAARRSIRLCSRPWSFTFGWGGRSLRDFYFLGLQDFYSSALGVTAGKAGPATVFAILPLPAEQDGLGASVTEEPGDAGVFSEV